MTSPCFSDPGLDCFSGLAPLFPLPNVVLFPHGLLPLHIFEPRYREMTEDALEGEQLIAMCRPQPGWERLPENVPPPLLPIMGLGRIIAHERLDDGRFVLVLRGLSRVRLVQEERVPLRYRVGKLELCHDTTPDTATFDRQARADSIVSLFCQLFPGHKYQQLLKSAISGDVPLSALCDIIASTIPASADLSQQFLDEFNSDSRSEMLWYFLKQAVSRKTDALKRSFPPDFSHN